MNRIIDWAPKTKDSNNYSTFNTCLKVEFNNPFWQAIFEACSRGDLPPGFGWICKERCLTYSNGGPEERYPVPGRSNTKMVATYIVDVFTSKGIVPPASALKMPTTSRYSDIKGRVSIININEIFIREQVMMYGLSPEQRRQLATVMGILQLGKMMNDNTVIMKCGKIEEVTCIRFYNGQYVFA